MVGQTFTVVANDHTVVANDHMLRSNIVLTPTLELPHQASPCAWTDTQISRRTPQSGSLPYDHHRRHRQRATKDDNRAGETGTPTLLVLFMMPTFAGHVGCVDGLPRHALRCGCPAPPYSRRPGVGGSLGTSCFLGTRHAWPRPSVLSPHLFALTPLMRGEQSSPRPSAVDSPRSHAASRA